MCADMTPLTRAEAKERRVIDRAVSERLKSECRSAGWRRAGGVFYREVDGWFISFTASVHLQHCRTQILLSLKPMALDPILWDIVQLPDNRDQPLSFRASGAWTCRPSALEDRDVDEGDGSAETITASILRKADTLLTSSPFRTDHAAYLDFLVGHRNVAPHVTMLCWLNRFDDARQACHDAIARGDSGGFAQGNTTFPEMALNWLQQR